MKRVAVALGVVAAALAAAGSAGAHAYLLESSPPDTAVVQRRPAELRLRFSEPVDVGPHALELLDARGKPIRTADARRAPGRRDTAVLPLPPGLPRGTYVVGWRVVSEDSHPVSGGLSFSIGAPSPVVTASPERSSRAVAVLDAASRGVAFAGLALAIGGAFFLLVLWPEGRRGRRLLWGGIGALGLGTLLLLLLQGPYATGSGVSGIFRPSLLDFSVSTRFGHALLVRLGLIAAFAVLVALALRGRRVLPPLGVCAVGLVLTWTLSDHSSTGIQKSLGIPAATAHMLAMALWLGGLAFLLACAPGWAVVSRFSRFALPCFIVLAATGVYLAWRQTGSLAALPHTLFGRLLLVKAGIVLAIVTLAWFSRRAAQRSASVRRTVTGEALLGVAVLGVTAVLVNAVPARIDYRPPIDVHVAGPAGTPLDGGDVEVKVKPARAGENVADVYLVDSEGHLVDAPEVTGILQPPGTGVGPLTVAFAAAEPGHYVASPLTIPFTGRWRLHLDIRTSDIDETGVEVPLRVR